jgi:NADH-quinone oxidoreductase subunit K
MLEITTTHYLILAAVLFGIGMLGVMTRRNLIVVLMSLELMLNAVNLNLIAFSYQLADLGGQVFVVFTVVVAAGEVAIGLGILLALYRLHQTTDLDRAVELKG